MDQELSIQSKNRLKLQSVLEDILGSRNVYFQPPTNITMKYPAIVYTRVSDKTKYAGNSLYSRYIKYQITVMDRDPDSQIPQGVSALQNCSFDRHFVADSLNHDVFNIYY